MLATSGRIGLTFGSFCGEGHGGPLRENGQDGSGLIEDLWELDDVWHELNWGCSDEDIAGLRDFEGS